RHDGTVRDGPRCPGTTDFVLHISEQRPAADEAGAGPLPQGYACLANLKPPHPADPGAGGGPPTTVAACVYALATARVRATRAAGAGRAPSSATASTTWATARSARPAATARASTPRSTG